MKRSKPLARRTGLRPGGKLRRRSAKTADLYRKQRAPLVKELLEERPTCQRKSCWNRSTDVHEPLLRSRGGNPYDKTQCIVLCRPCHTWVHNNPRAATAEGLMRNSWDGAA